MIDDKQVTRYHQTAQSSHMIPTAAVGKGYSAVHVLLWNWGDSYNNTFTMYFFHNYYIHKQDIILDHMCFYFSILFGNMYIAINIAAHHMQGWV